MSMKLQSTGMLDARIGKGNRRIPQPRRKHTVAAKQGRSNFCLNYLKIMNKTGAP